MYGTGDTSAFPGNPSADAEGAFIEANGVFLVGIPWGEPHTGYALLDTTPLLRNGGNTDFVYLVATRPGRHSGGQVHNVKKTAAPTS